MKHAATLMRRQVYIAVLSCALLPLAATAQTQTQTPTHPAAQAHPQSQPANATGYDTTTQPNGSQQSMGASAKGSATASGSSQAGATKGAPAVKPLATFVLVPVASPLQDQWMKSGCWAKLHDNTGFTGDSLTLSGPIDMPDMLGPFGIDWKSKISSIETGANTTLTVYDNVNYRDPVSTFKPGVRIADVSKRMGFFDDMRSLRITCTGAGSTAAR